MTKNYIPSLRGWVIFLLGIIFTSCEKEAGEGGNSSIKGYIHVKDYNISFLILQAEYPGANEDVYIIYGDDISYGDRIQASPDGTFEFKYLRKGKYKVYVYSDDTTASGQSVVVKEVEIARKKMTVDAGTFEIKKN